MNAAPRSGHPLWNAQRLTLVLGAVALLGLTHCKLVPDSLTGLDKAKRNRGNCVSKCAHQANEAREREKDLHEEKVDDCNHDPACLAAEKERYRAALDQIEADRHECISGCHHQGGGHGGGDD